MKPVIPKKCVQNGTYYSDDKFTLSNPINPTRRANARRQRNGRRNASVGKENGQKGGRRRRARSMGRYPFFAMIPKYIEDHSAVFCPLIRKQKRQRLEWIGRRMEELKKQGTISTTNPRRITKDDAIAIVNDLSRQTWTPGYLEKMVSHLKLFVNYCGNPVFMELSARKLLPNAPDPQVKTLSDKELLAIRLGAEKIQGWHGEVARFLIDIFPATGLRVNELRLTRIQDIDIEKWEIRVIHPKGERKFASQRISPILPQGREATLRFLGARKKRLEEKGIIEAEPLIPCIKNRKADYYTIPGLRRFKLTVQDKSGIRFTYKDFRSTFAQRTIDLDPSLLSPVSKALGHKTTVTTEHYYARIRDAPAIRQIQDAWEKHQDRRIQSGLIDRKTPPTGYY